MFCNHRDAAERISDTQVLAGSEAYVSALAAYRNFEAAAYAGIPGADTVYDLLRTRFANQGNTGSTTTPPATRPPRVMASTDRPATR